MRKEFEIIGGAQSHVAFGGGGNKEGTRRNKTSVGESTVAHDTESTSQRSKVLKIFTAALLSLNYSI